MFLSSFISRCNKSQLTDTKCCRAPPRHRVGFRTELVELSCSVEEAIGVRWTHSCFAWCFELSLLKMKENTCL
jgi:hypothetical protein